VAILGDTLGNIQRPIKLSMAFCEGRIRNSQMQVCLHLG
jgi:hypothetical protein